MARVELHPLANAQLHERRPSLAALLLRRRCLVPVEDWAGGGERGGVAAIVGIEADALGVRDWAKHWGRELQFAQWTLAAAPGHPLLALVLWRCAGRCWWKPRHALG